MQLRNSIPLFLVLSGLVFGLALAVYQRGQFESQQRRAIFDQVRTLGLLAAADIESAYRNAETARSGDIINHLSGFPAISSVMLFDPANRVLSASRYHLEGEPIEATELAGHGDQIQRCRLQRRSEITLVSGGDRLVGCFPIRLDPQLASMRDPAYGILALKVDLTPALSQARKTALVGALLIFACFLLLSAGIWFYLQQTLLRRLQRLGTQAAQIAAGTFTPVALEGSDEIADLARDFDRMAAALEQNTSALARSEAQSRLIIQHLPRGLVQIYNEKLQLVFSEGPEAEKLHITTLSAGGKPLHEFLSPDQAAAFTATIQAGLQGEFQDLELKIGQDTFRVHGVLLPGSANQPRRVLLLAVNISDRARAEAEILRLNLELKQALDHRTLELASSEARYRTLTEAAPQVIWATNAEGRTTYLNKAWYELTGLSPALPLEEQWCQALHPDDRQIAMAAWQQSLETGKPYTLECRFRAEDGAWHTVLCLGIPVRTDQGMIRQWVGINTDITDRKLAEQALLEVNRELEAFSYSISHDLRAPLRAISGFARILVEDTELTEAERQRYLQIIMDNGEKMSRLINELLAHSRIGRQAMAWEQIDMNHLLETCIQDLSQDLGDRQIEFRRQPLPPARGDRTMLRQIWTNLVDNALKYSRPRHPAIIEIGTLEGQTGPPTYFIRDNGVGFDMRYAHKLFGVFQRLHLADQFEGTGVGLAIVQRIIHRHGGRVWAEAKPDQGATFYFTFSKG